MHQLVGVLVQVSGDLLQVELADTLIDQHVEVAEGLGVEYDSSEADKLTQETLGEEAEELKKAPALPPQQRSTLAERAARGPQGGAAPGR